MFIILAVVGFAAYHLLPLERRDHRVLGALGVVTLAFGLLMLLFSATTIVG